MNFFILLLIVVVIMYIENDRGTDDDFNVRAPLTITTTYKNSMPIHKCVQLENRFDMGNRITSVIMTNEKKISELNEEIRKKHTQRDKQNSIEFNYWDDDRIE